MRRQLMGPVFRRGAGPVCGRHKVGQHRVTPGRRPRAKVALARVLGASAALSPA